MRRRIRRRRDGLVEIRRVSWRDVFVNRDTGSLGALAVAWLAAMVMLVESLVISPLLIGAAGVVMLTIACALTGSPWIPTLGENGVGGRPPARSA